MSGAGMRFECFTAALELVESVILHQHGGYPAVRRQLMAQIEIAHEDLMEDYRKEAERSYANGEPTVTNRIRAIMDALSLLMTAKSRFTNAPAVYVYLGQVAWHLQNELLAIFNGAFREPSSKKKVEPNMVDESEVVDRIKAILGGLALTGSARVSLKGADGPEGFMIGVEEHLQNELGKLFPIAFRKQFLP